MTRETALKELKLFLGVPISDIDELMKCVEQKDWVKLKRTVKAIRKRKAEYGI